MTIEERYELSLYEELTRIEDGKDVFLVRHQETGMLYVKKRMQLYNKSVYQSLMQLRIPDVPWICLCVEEDDSLIVIEEYIQGMSLKKMYEQHGNFSESAVVTWMLALLDTMQALHESNPTIVHRDVKPSNIMITREGKVKLIDFNAAREVRTSASEDTCLMGTRRFAAPEQYGFGQSDARTDIYAIGATMYYLLSGDFPESGKYCGTLLPVIQKCMELDKRQRYQTVRELRAALQAVVSVSEVSSGADRVPHSRSKAPVGFRSGTLWKMIVAIVGYIFIFWLSLTLHVNDKDGMPLQGYALVMNRIAAWLALMGTVAIAGDYCGIMNRLPGRNRTGGIRHVMTAVYIVIWWILVIMVLVMLGG